MKKRATGFKGFRVSHNRTMPSTLGVSPITMKWRDMPRTRKHARVRENVGRQQHPAAGTQRRLLGLQTFAALMAGMMGRAVR